MLFEEIAVYCKNHMKQISCGQNAMVLSVKIGGAYIYRYALKGKLHSFSASGYKAPKETRREQSE
jgi:hypothetical protein